MNSPVRIKELSAWTRRDSAAAYRLSIVDLLRISEWSPRLRVTRSGPPHQVSMGQRESRELIVDAGLDTKY